MFKKILIANRGEIACRVIRTAHKMGIQCVAVYSDADRDAPHVNLADEAICIGPSEASKSYLVMDKIIAACLESGAQAVHPGYGFLSENANFVQRLKEHDIVFIGPNELAIKAMGDKIESKKRAAAAGVSTVPGYLGEIADSKQAVKIAREIGFPVMIKASAGGGGKGMRLAYSEEETIEGFDLARSEAKSSFGDERIFIEKFITNPRHIEIQILGDKHDNVLFLNERECSIQRRNQKVIEEAPSPLLTEKTRRAMGEQAVALAKAVSYDSAGTVEFVAGQDASFYFLEMNTRLQVEHPVTEMITGIDLVEQMIRVAASEKLTLKQSDIKINGWSIESRIYAEDPYRGFLPSIGRLVRYAPPKALSGSNSVRVDTGVEEGGQVHMYYDPMIAKLITHGATRSDAINGMAEALDSFVVQGIQHNIPFLASLMQHPRWKDGNLSTGFIAEEYPEGFKGHSPSAEEAKTLAAVASWIDNKSNQRRAKISGQLPNHHYRYSGERVVLMDDLTFHLTLKGNNEKFEAEISNDDEDAIVDRFTVESDWNPGQARMRARVNNRDIVLQVIPVLNGYRLLWRGLSTEAYIYTKEEARCAALMPKNESQNDSRHLICPMPGKLLSIRVVVGQVVKAGEAICVVEAMKMENILRAEGSHKVKCIHFHPGDNVAVDDIIMEFE